MSEVYQYQPLQCVFLNFSDLLERCIFSKVVSMLHYFRNCPECVMRVMSFLHNFSPGLSSVSLNRMCGMAGVLQSKPVLLSCVCVDSLT